MYRGFNVKIKTYTEHLYNQGVQMLKENKIEVKDTLDSFIGIDGVINGSDLQKNWFRNIKSHIFISHSHKDEKLAISLAGFLYEKYGLISFVDSVIWGYSNTLLKKIDDRYCKNSFNDSYNYDLRNYSTSHVHMMLSTALNMMIDNCECLFFLNTPNSLTTSEILNETYSPWIYSEISISKIINKRTPKRLKLLNEDRTFSKSANENEKLNFKYTIDLNHLEELCEEEIVMLDVKDSSIPENALDAIYKLKPMKKVLL